MKKILIVLLLTMAFHFSAMAQQQPAIQLRTNALYCLAASPNVGIEIQADNGLAWQLDYIGAWWNSYKGNRFWSNYAFQTELRYYMSAKRTGMPYTGHHLGGYGQLMSYDFELGKKGIICPDLGDTWGVGISYGYTKALTPHLAIDFTLGIGYIQSHYDAYKPNFDNSWWSRTKSGTLKTVFPTKAEIALVWTINTANRVVGKKTKSIIYY